MDDFTVPADITYDDFREALPKIGTIVDSNNVEHEVELRWDIRPYNFDNYKKPGQVTLWSQFFKLPLEVSNTIPSTRLEIKLKVIFE
ncbi:hypothetical protein [Clostridium sp. Cult1]|uniref:hypothetical protein n=1 Tax=Clostridium sp. Cult1 TaxID=2079002 RepID=UPI001F33F4C1|nr:hypothetical protein [Clostridium sp. Cult1]MCF6462193.1 hypothetical protein [Clostridium sp. Cult1]